MRPSLFEISTIIPDRWQPPIMLNHEIACQHCEWTGYDSDCYHDTAQDHSDTVKCPACGRNDGLYGLDDEIIKSKLGLSPWANDKELKIAHEEYLQEYRNLTIAHAIGIIKNVIQNK